MLCFKNLFQVLGSKTRERESKRLRHFVKLFFSFIFVAAFFFTTHYPVYATTYYVDNTITDTNVASSTPDCTTYEPVTNLNCTGGSASAYHSIADINATTFQADDQILFRRGQTWNEKLVISSSGTSGHPIIIADFGSGAKPKLDESVQKTDWVLDSGAIYKRTASGEVGSQVNELFQDGARLNKITSCASMVAGSWCDAGSGTLKVWTSDSSNPNTNHVIEHPIYNNSIDFNGKSFITVRNIIGKRSKNGVFNFRQVANAHDITCQYCEAAQSGFRGFDGGGTIGVTTKYNITLDTVKAYDNVSEGIWMGIGHDITINNCEVYDGHKDAGKGYTNVDLGGVNIGDSVSTVLVTGCYVHDIYDGSVMGIEWESGATQPTSITIERSHFLDNQAHVAVGGNVWIAGTDSSSVFRNNLVEETASSCGSHISHGISIANGTGGGNTGVKIYNNTVIHRCTSNWPITGSANNYSDIENNIFRNTVINSVILIPVSTPTSILKNNLYYGFNGTRFYGQVGSNSYTTLSTWETATGETGGQIASPSLVNESSDYHLQSNSPAIKAGINLGITNDYDGLIRPFQSPPDIGAYEYLAAPAAPTTLTQKKTDTTTISSGGYTNETSVNLGFSMSSTNASDSLVPQVEVQPIATPFTNIPTATGSAVPASGSPVTGSVSVTGLSTGTTYHWQAQISNASGNGTWTSMGGNPDFGVDTAAPSTTDNVDSSWHTSAVTVTLSCSDTGGSGCAHTYYTTDGTTPTTSSSSGSGATTNFSLSSDGAYTIKYFSVDNAGNSETVKTATNQVKIDQTAPALSSKTTFSSWYTSNQISTFTYTDSGSGIASGIPVTCTISTEGSAQTCSVTPNVCDAAGNCNTTPVTSNGANIDKTAPVTSDSGTDSSWHTSSVTVTLTCSDTGGSGCLHTYYTTDGTTPTTSSSVGNSIVLSADGTYTIKYFSVDTAGNQESVKTAANTVKIDATAPSIHTPSTSSATNNTKPTWTWTASTDSGSGLTATPYTVQWSQDASFVSGVSSSTSTTNSFTHSTALADGTWYFRVDATDVAGNTSSWSSNGSFNLVTSTPNGSVAINSGASYTNSSSVTLTISATDSVYASSLLTMKVSNLSDLSDASYQSFSSTLAWTLASPTVDGTKTVYIKFKNPGGNESGIYSSGITYDTTPPIDFNLDSPGSNSYTNSERPSFRWNVPANADATSGLSKYKLDVNNGDSGSFTIDSIPTSGTSDISNDKYVIHFDGFNDSDTTNNYISVYTKSSSQWGSSENDGKVKEGKRSWKVTAYDNAGNSRDESRTLFVDRSSPSVTFTQLNDIQTGNLNNFSTTKTKPTIYGKITDALAGDKTDNKVVSGPKSVEVRIEKKNNFGLYDLYSLTTVNLTETYWSSSGNKITDNSQNTDDKYSTFGYTPTDSLPLGDYKITLTGKDNADNTGGQISFTLTIAPLAQVVTPEEKTIINEGTKNLTPEQKETVTKQLEITNPVTPTPTPKPNIISQAWQGISRIFGGINNFFGNIVKYIAEVGQQGKADLAQIFKTPKQFTAKLGEWLAYSTTSFGEIVLDSNPTQISEVKVEQTTPTTAIITWKTNHLATSKVNYGLTKDFGKDVQTSTKVHDHKLEITGLTPGTKYQYEVMSQNKNYVYDANHEFTTPKK